MSWWSKPLGFVIRKPEEEKREVSIVPKDQNDGAVEQVTSGAGFYGYNYGFEFVAKNEIELISKYRQIQLLPELDSAIEDIVSEAIAVEEFDEEPIRINIRAEEEEIPEQVREIIAEEFKNVLSVMDFQNMGHDIFRQWYVDGRIYFHLIVDESDLSKGIREARIVDPRKIKKVRQIEKERTAEGLDVVTNVEEFFIFNDLGITNNQGAKLSVDTVAYTPSGLVDENNQVISYLHKAIKPANMLRSMEDAMLIYQMTRAPDRRVFYVDVSGMQKTKAEQYLKDVMTRYKNKVVYNSATGEVRDDRNHISMLEDFWMPRQSSGRGTEITTLQGAQVQGQIEALMAYKDKLAKALNVPLSRMMSDTPFNVGRSMEITRDEVKFAKFIKRLRRKFCDTFNQILRVQLIVKGIISPEDWEFIKTRIQYEFVSDNNFAELRDNEVLQQRLSMYEEISPLIGVYFSEEYAKKKILKMTDEEIIEEEQKIEKERMKRIQAIQQNPQMASLDPRNKEIMGDFGMLGQGDAQ